MEDIKFFECEVLRFGDRVCDVFESTGGDWVCVRKDLMRAFDNPVVSWGRRGYKEVITHPEHLLDQVDRLREILTRK